MPTKRVFDLVIVCGLLLPPAWGLVRLASRRWVRESTGIMTTLGSATQLSQGK